MLDLAKNTMSDVYDEECIVTSATTSHFDDDLSDVINKSLQICEISGKCSVTTATLLHTIFLMRIQELLSSFRNTLSMT